MLIALKEAVGKLLLFGMCCVLVVPAAAAAVYSDFPYGRDDLTERSLLPGSRDVNFIINSLPVTYVKPKGVDLDDLLAKYKNALQILGSSQSYGGGRHHVMSIEADDRDALYKALDYLRNPRLSVEDHGSLGFDVYYTPRPQPGFEQEDRTLVRFAEGIALLKAGQVKQAEKTFQDVVSQKTTSGARTTLALDCLALAQHMDHNPASAAESFRQAAQSTSGQERDVMLYRMAMASNNSKVYNDLVSRGAYHPGNRPLHEFLAPALHDTWEELSEIPQRVFTADEERKAAVEAEVAHNIAAFKGMFAQCGPPCIAIIQGNLAVAKDTTKIEEVSQRSGTETNDGVSFSVSQKKAKTILDVGDVPIYLVRARGLNAFDQVISEYAAEHGYDKKEFGHSWPSIHDEAQAIRQLLADRMKTVIYQNTSTSKPGDFRFGKVPAGDYALFASINNGTHAMVWFLPVHVGNANTITKKLTRASATMLWAKTDIEE